MNGKSFRTHLLTFLAGLSALVHPAIADAEADRPKVIRFSGTETVFAGWQGREATVQKGRSLGQWVLMAVVQPKSSQRLAVFEDFSQTNGHLLFADQHAVQVDLAKSS